VDVAVALGGAETGAVDGDDVTGPVCAAVDVPIENTCSWPFVAPLGSVTDFSVLFASTGRTALNRCVSTLSRPPVQ
jgi:hypothetical protein